MSCCCGAFVPEPSGGGGGGAPGIQSLPEVWSQNDVPASQAATALSSQVSQLFDTVQAIRDGSIVGINVRWTAAIAAGQATIIVTINGVAGTLSVVMVAPAQSARATQAAGDLYSAGDLIGVQLATNAGFLPADSNDVEVWLEVS